MNLRRMEKIDPLQDHLRLQRFAIGEEVELQGLLYTVVSRTTLASGEPALVLRREGGQFVIGASQLLAGVKERA